MEHRSHKKSARNWILILIGVILVATAAVLSVLSLLNGSTTTTNTGANIETTKSITCESNDIPYPPAAKINPPNQSIKINATFDNNKLDTISLTYRIKYPDESTAKQSTTNLHIAINQNFQEDSLGTDALNAKYSTIENTTQLSLYAKSKSITGMSAKYFLLDTTSDIFKQDHLTKIYSDKGLNCIVNK